ncbi:MAG: zinc ribbon domain-containing protein, partial [Chromatiales bacterium]|nr:zinc ribbon domain-containing protein [Chromatiales bacterium]
MPIYEYRCQDCEHQFDTIQKMSADPLVDCPSCGKGALKKLLSAPSFQLKGTGWYETDFKTKKKDDGS